MTTRYTRLASGERNRTSTPYGGTRRLNDRRRDATRYVHTYSGDNDFIIDVKRQAQEGRTLTTRQVDAVLSFRGESKRRRAERRSRTYRRDANDTGTRNAAPRTNRPTSCEHFGSRRVLSHGGLAPLCDACYLDE